MNALNAKLKILFRLNKLGSQDYSGIEDVEIREAVNKAQLEWLRRQIHGINVTKEGDEESRVRIDDLQALIKDNKLNVTNRGLYFETENLPNDYLWFKSVLIYAKTNKCEDKQLMLDVHLIEEANVNEWLNDWSKQPSFNFRQCFYTLANNKLRVYSNGDFQVTDVVLIYYRKPQQYNLEGIEEFDGSISQNSDIEFKDDVAEIIIDEAVSIIAGDIENISAYQTSSKRKEENN